ncbi:MAG TPA: TonB-dependent receptor plug domain-containing protein, partial [Sphingomicrobium sp.]|nr:TonB-dependent receptor plug domain-containing protein [Sphingomicrobium sp.]
MRAFALAGTAIAMLMCGTTALARQAGTGTSAANRTTVYEASFFAQYAPRTAYDIAQHVPGFQLDLGSTQSVNGSVDVRGFAGTAGNVVIDGSRPSTKSETLDTTLKR